MNDPENKSLADQASDAEDAGDYERAAELYREADMEPYAQACEEIAAQQEES